MKTDGIFEMKPSLLLKTVLVAGILFWTFTVAFPKDALAREKNSDSKEEWLHEKALLKKKLFYWQLKLIGSLELAEGQIHAMQTERVKLGKSIEKLEFLARMKKQKNGAHPDKNLEVSQESNPEYKNND